MGLLSLMYALLLSNSEILNINGGLLNPSHILLYDEVRKIQNPANLGRGKRVMETKVGDTLTGTRYAL